MHLSKGKPVKTLKNLLIVLCLLTPTCVSGQAIEWRQVFDSGRDDTVNAVTIDSSGNIFLAGDTSEDDRRADSLLVKYGRDGELQWSREFGSPEIDIAWGAYAETSGSVYVSGQTWENQPTNNADAFVTKLSSDGSVLWERKIVSRGQGWDFADAVTGDGLGSIYVAGTTAGSFDRPNQGTMDAFLMKFDQEGNQIWTRQFGTSGWDRARDVVADGFGNIFVVGEYDQKHNQQQDPNPDDAFLAKYDASGKLDWINRIGDSETKSRVVRRNSVVTDGKGNVYLAYTSATSGHLRESTGYLSKYSEAGDLLWSQEFSEARLNPLSIDESGDVYLPVNGRLHRFDQDGNLEQIYSRAGIGFTAHLTFNESGEAFSTGGGTSRSQTQDISLIKVDLEGISGDVDANGVVDVADIDQVLQVVSAGSYESAADVNFDNHVDADDIEAWIERIKNSYVGDANLDGEFNSSDFVTVFIAGQYEDDVDGNSTWATGDWNGDAEFTSSDFVFALAQRGYDRGTRTAVSVVPEPTAITHVLLLLIVFAISGRRALS